MGGVIRGHNITSMNSPRTIPPPPPPNPSRNGVYLSPGGLAHTTPIQFIPSVGCALRTIHVPSPPCPSRSGIIHRRRIDALPGLLCMCIMQDLTPFTGPRSLCFSIHLFSSAYGKVQCMYYQVLTLSSSRRRLAAHVVAGLGGGAA